jgi:hypothetical protein
MPRREQVLELIALVEEGRFIDAMERYYAADATMQENQQAPRSGLLQLLAHENMVLSNTKSVVTRPVDFFAIDGEQVAIHWVFEFTLKNGHRFVLDEMAWQRWHNGKVAEEKFFYDPAQRQVFVPAAPAHIEVPA